MRRHWVVGSLNHDITHRVPAWPAAHMKLRALACWSGPGGSAANTAYWLGRGGAAASMVGTVGDDPYGRRCIDSLAAAAVDTTWVRVLPDTPTPLASVLVCGDQKCIVTSGSGGDALPQALPPADAVRAGDHVHLSCPDSAALADWVRRVQAGGATLSVDWNGRDHRGAYGRIDVSFLNEDELARLPGLPGDVASAAAVVAAASGGRVVVTQGARGAGAWDPADGWCFRPTRAVTVVDRTGGGDAFDAGYLLRWLDGAPPEACLDAGLALAAEVVQRQGTR